MKTEIWKLGVGRWQIGLFLFILLLSSFCFRAAGQSYNMDWYKVAGSTGTSTGGGYNLTATIGQADAGGGMSGGNYSMSGGFWSLVNVSANQNQSYVGGGYYENLVTNTANLLGYWRFDPLFQTNSCVNGYTGTLQGNAKIGAPGSGHPLPADPANQSLVLDGGNSWLLTSLTGHITNQATVMAWVYLTNQPSVMGHTFYVAGDSQSGDDLDLQIQTDNHVYFFTDNNSPWSSTACTNSLSTNQWHFLAASFVASGNRVIYLDGAPVATSTAGGHSVNNNPFTIGASYVWGGRFFAGRISDVAVFNRALSASEISAFYAAASPALTNVTLTVNLSGNGVVISWPAAAGGWTLQTNSNLATTNWGNYAGTVVNNTVTNAPPPNGNLFFRLKQ